MEQESLMHETVGPLANGHYVSSTYHPQTKQTAVQIRKDSESNFVSMSQYDHSGWIISKTTYWKSETPVAQKVEHYATGLFIGLESFNEIGVPDNALMGGTCAWQRAVVPQKGMQSVAVADWFGNKTELVDAFQKAELKEVDLQECSDAWQKVVKDNVNDPVRLYQEIGKKRNPLYRLIF